MPTCGAASPPGGLLLLEPGEQQRFLAALVEFRKMILHARLAASAAGLDAGTFELVVRSAGLGNCGTADQGVSARCRELGEVLADARRDPAVAGLDPGAHSVDVRPAGLPRRPLLGCSAAQWQKRQQRRCNPDPSNRSRAARPC